MELTRKSASADTALRTAVAHRDFIAQGAATLGALDKAKSILYDVKSALPADQVDGRL